MCVLSARFSFLQVKVMLRVSDDPPKPTTQPSGQEEPTPTPTPSYLTVDKKKRQVTLCEPQSGLAAAVAAAAAGSNAATVTQERGPMVSAPKMFAFDALFTTEDSQ
ncbi:hypothetical protein pipiens_006509, partial [Culex pipiens pipiens]